MLEVFHHLLNVLFEHVCCLPSNLFVSVAVEPADPTAGMSGREKKMYELQQRLRQSRKANENAVIAEKRKQQVMCLQQPCAWQLGAITLALCAKHAQSCTV